MRGTRFAVVSVAAFGAVALMPASAQASRFSWWGPLPDQATCTQKMLEVEDAGFAVAACRPAGQFGAPASPAGWYFPYFMPVQT